jgi:hypothetical protein
MALGDGGQEPAGGIGYGVRRRHADGVEPFAACQILDQGAQPLRRQKSSFS